MERKYTVMLCFLALLFLGGTAFAGNTPWPKWDNSFGWNYLTHWYFGCPNVQGPNGQGQGWFVQYQSSDFKKNSVGVMVAGLNIHVHDFNNGANTLKMKAFEMRYENPNLFGCPDWSANGKLAELTPVPYISNWASLRQYPFTGGPIAYPSGFNTLAVVQYNPAHNHCAGGMPMIPSDNGIGGQMLGSSGRTFGFGGTSCFGPFSRDVWLALYGNPPPPAAEARVTIANVWYSTPSDVHSMTQGQGVKMFVQLVNNIFADMNWGPGQITMYMHEGNRGWNWWIRPGVDLISTLSGGTKTSPQTVRIKPAGFGVGVKLNNLFGTLGDYLFNTYTLETRLSRPTSPGSVDVTDVDEWMMCPRGAEDDSEYNGYWYMGTSAGPGAWGRGLANLFNKNHVAMPGGSFTIDRVDTGVTSWYAGGGVPLYRADVRSEATLGYGQPLLTTAGLLGTFDRRIQGFWLSPQAAYDYPTGSAGIPIANAAPMGNIYTLHIFNPSNLSTEGWLTDSGGKNHVGFGNSFISWGGGSRPFSMQLMGKDGINNYLQRIITSQPLDGTEVDLKALPLRKYGPTATKYK
jgi:hypothetical protein